MYHLLNKYQRLDSGFQFPKLKRLFERMRVNSREWWRLEWIGGSLPGGSSIGPSDGGVEDSRRGFGAWLQQICRSGHDLRESASALIGVVLGGGCCVWWPDEPSSVNCACMFATCGERQRSWIAVAYTLRMC